MERRQLEYFLAVVEHGGATRASAHLHVSQPTISAALRKLEKELGGALFERAAGGLVLTGAGKALLEPAGQVIRDFAVAADSVRDVLGLQGGSLDLVAVPAVSAGWLPPVVAAFRRAHPKVAITVRSELDNTRIADDVRRGRFDLGLAVSAVADPGLVTHEVGHQDLQAIFPPGAGGAGEPVGLDELLTFDMVTVPPERSAARQWFEAELRRRGRRTPRPVEVASIDGVLPMVREGVGYALWWSPISPSLVGPCVLRPVRPRYRRPILVVLRGGPLPPATQAFVRAAGLEQARA
ncbi:LysR family transcriptional regulator [Prauserella sp. PE36]|uniref:LysR family transcriptional regulator n=1 Tax=Prauserella endophytica TaxID=1592324 RepID=A0ABY2S738_9PSEU|nr:MULTISPECIES: LysR family transcriptional regulator [Prauserella]PXY25839.1 hypothetical protein BAY59_19890 [Prauserella coralliicola]RBM22264.1 LysR family transcriptional regulator [Prauserella sp. PE36]TKG71722.1 LysR family transcriptional regulator [Prauserella endophytica]